MSSRSRTPSRSEHGSRKGADVAARPPLPERYAQPMLIAVGGMGSVWRARDEILGRVVAVKLLADSFAGDAGAVRRFMREARAAAHLSGHPNVVTIYDVGECDDRPYIVMEHLPGGSVADALRLGAYSRGEALRWLEQAAAALDHAHARGVVHGDVKPANMLLSADRTLHLADFGIASLGTDATITGELFGTAAYLAPEQARGDPSTAATDRYALAVAGFELLVGRGPFEGEGFTAQARAHIEDPPPKASARASDLPGDVDAVLARGMAKNPEERWPTASSFAQALRQALTQPVRRRRVIEDAGGVSSADAALAAATAALAEAAPSPAGLAGAAARPSRAHRPVPVEEPPLVIFDSIASAGPGRRLRGPLGLTAALAAVALAAGIAVGASGGAGAPRRVSADRAGGQPAAHSRRPSATERSAPAGRGVDRRARVSRRSPSTAPVTEASASAAAALEARGHSLMAAGEYAQALSVLHEALAAAPRDTLTYAYALYDLGRTLRLDGHPAQAIPVLEARLRIPNQPTVVRQELRLAEAAAASPGGAATPPTDAPPGTGGAPAGPRTTPTVTAPSGGRAPHTGASPTTGGAAPTPQSGGATRGATRRSPRALVAG